MNVHTRPIAVAGPSPYEPDNLDAEQGSDHLSSAVPFVTRWMLVVISVLFLAMVLVGHGQAGGSAHLFGAKEPALIRAGEWWRLIMPIFLHGNWIHLIVNAVSLIWFGGQMERIYGGRRFFLIYMVAGICGNILSCLMLPAPSLGASGALFGLIGAGIVFPLRFGNLLLAKERTLILRQLSIVALINLGLSFVAGIDRYAHFGGFLGGAFVALFLMPEVLDDRPRNAFRDRFLTFSAMLMLLFAVSAAAEQWATARAEIASTPIAYSSSGSNSWWRFQLSRQWRPRPGMAGTGSIWLGPQGATINVVDSVSDPALFEHSEQWRAESGALAIPVSVGGRAATLSTVAANGKVTVLCQILGDGRDLDVSLVCSASAFTLAQRDYASLLDSLRIVPVPPTH